MPLQIVTDIKAALENGERIKESDLRALIASHEMLWRQIVNQSVPDASTLHRRQYMCSYMRVYRKRKRQEACALAATDLSSERH